MATKKQSPKPEKPAAEVSDAQKMASWRAGRKPLDTPKGKYGWGKKSSGKKERE